MTNTQRLTQLIAQDTLEYSLDKYDEYGVLEIFSDSLDAEHLRAQFIEQYGLTDIIVKEVFDGKKTIILGDCPEKITVIENDIKFIVQLKNDYTGLDLSKIELRNLISTYSKNKDVLDLFGNNGVNSIYALKGGPKSLSTVENSGKLVQKLKKTFEINSTNLPQIWDVTYTDFIDLARESRTKWDLIIIDLSDYIVEELKEFDLTQNHRDLIKNVQARLLKESGILIFVTNQKDFVLDQYIRPGADKLTNQIIAEDFKPLKNNQAFAFYN